MFSNWSFCKILFQQMSQAGKKVLHRCFLIALKHLHLFLEAKQEKTKHFLSSFFISGVFCQLSNYWLEQNFGSSRWWWWWRCSEVWSRLFGCWMQAVAASAGLVISSRLDCTPTGEAYLVVVVEACDKVSLEASGSVGVGLRGSTLNFSG